MKRKTGKKGQLEIGFNWIYVLVAGAVILLFFIGIVFRQATVSEQKLSANVLQEIEGIFTGAGLARQTTDFIDLPEVNIEFTCDDLTGYSDYAIEEGLRTETPWQPIFSPAEFETKRVLWWTLGWEFPFPVINYLFISSPDIKYYVDDEAVVSLPNNFNSVPFNSNDAVSYSQTDYQGEQQVRFVFTQVDALPNNGLIPADLKKMGDEQLTAVLFRANGIEFYQKDESCDCFELTGTAPLIYSSADENANLYAAVFSTDPDAYKCNLRKAFVRLEVLSRIYGKRIEQIQTSSAEGACQRLIDSGEFYGADDSLEDIAQTCQQSISQCGMIGSAASEIEQINENIRRQFPCPLIY